MASVTGRVGYAWDGFLGYVKGGGAWVQGDFGFQVAALPVAPTVSLSQSGWTVGVGGEYAFLNWLTGFIEYDYYRFNNNNSTALACTALVCGIAMLAERAECSKVAVKLSRNIRVDGSLGSSGVLD